MAKRPAELPQLTESFLSTYLIAPSVARALLPASYYSHSHAHCARALAGPSLGLASAREQGFRVLAPGPLRLASKNTIENTRGPAPLFPYVTAHPPRRRRGLAAGRFRRPSSRRRHRRFRMQARHPAPLL